jgi:hypothetical protein
MDRAPAKRRADVSRLQRRLPLGSERALPLTTIGRCSRPRTITLGTITVRNPAVAGNILRVLVFCRLTLGAKLMTQEESHPDQEGHADNRGRRQSGQVTEQGAPLSGRPTGLPACTPVTSLPTLIGVTGDEHWVIRRGPPYALLLIANGPPAAPSRLRGPQLRGTRSRAAGGRAARLPGTSVPGPETAWTRAAGPHAGGGAVAGGQVTGG